MNIAILMGRLTTDIELKTGGAKNTSIASFTVACDRDYCKPGEERQSDFISCTAFGTKAEFIAKYFSKGRMIGIVGTQQTGSYKDKNYPDVTHYTNKTIVEKAFFTGEKKADSNTPAAYGVNPQAQQMPQQTIPQNLPTSDANLNEFEEILGNGQLPF